MAKEPAQLLIWGDDGFEDCDPKKEHDVESHIEPPPSMVFEGLSAFDEPSWDASNFGDDFAITPKETEVPCAITLPLKPEPKAKRKSTRSPSANPQVFEDVLFSSPKKVQGSVRKDAEDEVARLLRQAGVKVPKAQSPSWEKKAKKSSSATLYRLDEVSEDDIVIQVEHFEPEPEPVVQLDTNPNASVPLYDTEDDGEFPEVEEERPRTPGKKRPKRKVPLLQRALEHLERREYSRADLRKKLLTIDDDEYTPERVDEALDQLEKLGYLSDARFAEIKVSSKARQWGNLRLRQELRGHGLDSSTIDEALETVEEPELLRCWRVWHRRFQERPTDRKTQDKHIRYLASRGFTLSCVFEVIRGSSRLEELLVEYGIDPDNPWL